jgi:hypothetical protein
MPYAPGCRGAHDESPRGVDASDQWTTHLAAGRGHPGLAPPDPAALGACATASVAMTACGIGAASSPPPGAPRSPRSRALPACIASAMPGSMRRTFTRSPSAEEKQHCRPSPRAPPPRAPPPPALQAPPPRAGSPLEPQGVLLTEARLPFALALPASGLLAMAFAALVGMPILRLKGHYFAIATLGVAETMREIVYNLKITGGGTGLTMPIRAQVTSTPSPRAPPPRAPLPLPSTPHLRRATPRWSRRHSREAVVLGGGIEVGATRVRDDRDVPIRLTARREGPRDLTVVEDVDGRISMSRRCACGSSELQRPSV